MKIDWLDFWFVLFALCVLGSLILAAFFAEPLDHSECKIIGYREETHMIPCGKGCVPFHEQVPIWEHHCKRKKYR